MMEQRKALVLGGTGLVGSHVLRLLLEDRAYGSVYAPVRRPLGFTARTLVELPFDSAAIARRLPVDDVFCCLGTTIKQAGSQENFRRVDFEYPLELARRASESGSKQFLIVTALGSSAQSPIFYNRVKGEIEAAVQALPFQSVHILRPSLLLGHRAEKRAGEEIASAVSGLVSWTLIGPMRKYRPIRGETVARAMVSLALENRSGRFTHESDEIEAIGSR